MQKQVIGQRHIVHAVPTIRSKLLRREVFPLQVNRAHHLSALDPKRIVRSHLGKAVANLSAVYGPCHAQRICNRFGANVEVPVEDRHVKHRVVCQRHVVGPIKLRQPLFGGFLCAAEPDWLPTIYLHRHTDHFKAWVTDILLRGLRLEA